MVVRIAYFVHGTTLDNEVGRATGWLPGALSERGRDESARLSRQTRHLMLDAVISSDLRRAIDSAEIVFGDRIEVFRDARLRECDYGELNGSLKASFGGEMTNYIDVPFPGGESYRDVEARVVSFLADLRAHCDGGHVALVGHQAPQLALDVLLRHKSWREAISEDWRLRGAWQPGWSYLVAP